MDRNTKSKSPLLELLNLGIAKANELDVDEFLLTPIPIPEPQNDGEPENPDQ